MAEKVGALGQLYGDVLSAPFKLANLPFKSYRQYYGKPKEKEKYTGSFLQKQRLKKVVNLIFSGNDLSENDRLFMDMFNDFLTGEGRKPIDQSEVTMTCQDAPKCKPYLYKNFGFIKKKKDDVVDDDDDTSDNDDYKSLIGTSVQIKFLEELKPKNSSQPYKNGNTYGFRVKNVIKTGRDVEIYITQSFLEQDDFLIFKTAVPNIFNAPIKFRVFQNNFIVPLRTPFDLGKVSAKIIK